MHARLLPKAARRKLGPMPRPLLSWRRQPGLPQQTNHSLRALAQPLGPSKCTQKSSPRRRKHASSLPRPSLLAVSCPRRVHLERLERAPGAYAPSPCCQPPAPVYSLNLDPAPSTLPQVPAARRAPATQLRMGCWVRSAITAGAPVARRALGDVWTTTAARTDPRAQRCTVRPIRATDPQPLVGSLAA
jgi:hypothetical protein